MNPDLFRKSKSQVKSKSWLWLFFILKKSKSWLDFAWLFLEKSQVKWLSEQVWHLCLFGQRFKKTKITRRTRKQTPWYIALFIFISIIMLPSKNCYLLHRICRVNRSEKDKKCDLSQGLFASPSRILVWLNRWPYKHKCIN